MWNRCRQIKKKFITSRVKKGTRSCIHRIWNSSSQKGGMSCWWPIQSMNSFYLHWRNTKERSLLPRIRARYLQIKKRSTRRHKNNLHRSLAQWKQVWNTWKRFVFHPVWKKVHHVLWAIRTRWARTWNGLCKRWDKWMKQRRRNAFLNWTWNTLPCNP